jgi:replicative DNA helicase
MRMILENPDNNIFMWLTEDVNGKTKHRANAIAKHILNKSDNCFKNIFISDDMPINVLQEINRKLEPTEDFYKLTAQLKNYNIIIMDPLLGFFGTNENDNAYAKKFMLLFTNWAKKENKTIIFIHHTDKGNNGARGAGALTDAARLVYLASPITDKEGKPTQTNKVKFSIAKDNNDILSLITVSEEGSFEREIFPPRNKPKFNNPVETTYEVIEKPAVKMKQSEFLEDDSPDYSKIEMPTL